MFPSGLSDTEDVTFPRLSPLAHSVDDLLCVCSESSLEDSVYLVKKLVAGRRSPVSNKKIRILSCILFRS